MSFEEVEENIIDDSVPEDIESLTEEQKTILKEKLLDQEWRMDNLYFITNEDGVKVKFHMNMTQRFLFRNRWFMNLILKARQLGITTFISIFFLDSVLFSENQSALVIAHTLDDARKIFDTKIKFAWDNLPGWLRSQFNVDTNTIYQLKFKTNGGSIAVSTSGRSGTYQYLHISEFGIICFRWPEKAEEIVTGTLQTVHKGNLVFIESTAKGRSGYFYDYCMKAIKDLLGKKELTVQDWKFFFFPWWEDPKYTLDGEVMISEEMKEYFEDLEVKIERKLTAGQKNWYVKKKEVLQDKMFSEFPSTPEEAFKASIEGAYYTKQLNAAYAEKRITKVPHDPSLLVFTFWDIGVGDETTIWFVQFFGNQIRLINYIHNSGESIHFYARELQRLSMEKGYVYGGHYGPHDLEVREIGNKDVKSRKQIAAELGLRFNIVQKGPVDAGIDQARAMFSMCWFDEEHCDSGENSGLKALQEYRKEWDEKNGMWKEKPLHNWASNGADAFRMLAVSYRKILGMQMNVGYKMDDDEMPREDIPDTNFDPHAPTGGLF